MYKYFLFQGAKIIFKHIVSVKGKVVPVYVKYLSINFGISYYYFLFFVSTLVWISAINKKNKWTFKIM